MKEKCCDIKNTKICPYRVYTQGYKAILDGSGDMIIQEFYPCIGDSCVAYHEGVCMRAYESYMRMRFGGYELDTHRVRD